jgi:glycerophosphoryl diester phosphodiesterase
VWTVNDPAQIRRMLDLGVDGIISDRPDLVREIQASPAK